MYKRIIIPLITVAVIILAVNLYFKSTDPLMPLRRQLISLSTGERYQGYFGLYRYYLENHDIASARLIEPKLDSNDIRLLQTDYYPELIAKSINELLYKKEKTAEDWVDIARLQSKIGLATDAKLSLKNASRLDPVRDDLEQLYLQFK